MKKVMMMTMCLAVLVGILDVNATVSDYVAYWQFEGNNDDSSANRYDWYPTAGWYDSNGIVGQAAKASYSSTDDSRVRTISSTPKINNVTDAFSVSMWIKPPANPQTGHYSELFAIWIEENNNRKFNISWAGWNGRIDVWLSQNGTGNDAYVSSGTTVAYDSSKWYQVVLSVDLNSPGDDAFVYVTDSSASGVVLAGSADLTMTSLYVPNSTGVTYPYMTCGQDNGNYGSNTYEGLIDELVFYDRALSQSEVQELFNLGKDGQHIPVPEPATIGLTALGIMGFLCKK